MPQRCSVRLLEFLIIEGSISIDEKVQGFEFMQEAKRTSSLASQLRLLKLFHLYGLVLYGLAALVLAGLVYSSFMDIRFALFGEMEKAQVVNLREHKYISQSYSSKYGVIRVPKTDYWVTYALLLDGAEYKKEYKIDKKSYRELSIGTAIDVKYIPDKPSAYRRVGPSRVGRLFWPVFFVTLLGGGGWLFTSLARSQRKKLLSEKS